MMACFPKIISFPFGTKHKAFMDDLCLCPNLDLQFQTLSRPERFGRVCSRELAQ